MSRRLGTCEQQHAERFIAQVIRGWARERESIDGITRSEQEIKEIVSEQVASLDARAACNWVGCEG